MSAEQTRRKNKRKSQEPRKLQTCVGISSLGGLLRPSSGIDDVGRGRLNSIGSEERSPPLPDVGSRSPSPASHPGRGAQSTCNTHTGAWTHLNSSKRLKINASSSVEQTKGTKQNVDSLFPSKLTGLPGYLLNCSLTGRDDRQGLPPVHLDAPEQDEPLDLIKPKETAAPADRRYIKHYSQRRTSRGPHPEDKQKRNYKNITRERRIEANARERQRVHTITAAFDTLQAAIPTNEENVKLSKLSVIKIATAYIMALSRMAGYDYTEDRSAPSVESVLQHCRQTIFNETKVKRRN